MQKCVFINDMIMTCTAVSYFYSCFADICPTLAAGHIPEFIHAATPHQKLVVPCRMVLSYPLEKDVDEDDVKVSRLPKSP